jgi:hypothetical protein
MTSLRHQLAVALDRMAEHKETANFQWLSFHIAARIWPELIAPEETKDEGIDGYVAFGAGVTNRAFACSISGELEKLRRDCERQRETGRQAEHVIFATARKVEEVTKTKWRDALRREFGIPQLDVISRATIIAELEKHSNLRWLCRDYMHMQLPEFMEMETHLPKVQLAAERLLSTWKQRYGFDDDLLLDLPLSQIGRDGRDESSSSAVSDLVRHLRAGSRWWLEGIPGCGKTFTLIRIASDLQNSATLVPILVSLRGWSQTGGSLLTYICEQAAFQLQGIDEPLLANALEAGRVVLLLNGWNEIASDRLDSCMSMLAETISQLPGAALVVVSRGVRYETSGFSCQRFRFQPLKRTHILTAAAHAGLTRPSDLFVNPQVAELATIPLFLREMILQVQLGHALPATRYEALSHMVERAGQEHRSSRLGDPVAYHADRFLSSLGWRMTDTGRTSLDETQARQVIAEVSLSLIEEAIFSTAPDPPQILFTLESSFLLVAEDAGQCAFIHQLIQEFFAAQELTQRLSKALARGDADTAFPMDLLDRYEWEQPVMLALDDLCSRGQMKAAAHLIRRLAKFDLEAACRAVGRNPLLWMEGRLDLGSKVEYLADLRDVNARWLAVRCAAASGQSDFCRLIWSALPESRWDTSSPFVGLPSASIIASFGSDFTERVLSRPSEDARLLALQMVDAPIPVAISCLTKIADNDSSSAVRLSAITKLVEFSAPGALRRLLREKRQTGRWRWAFLKILQQSARLTSSRLATLLRFSLSKEENEIERMRIWRFWAWHHSNVPGLVEITKSEFTRVPSSSLSRDGIYSRISEFLKAVATIDPEWASTELTKRIIEFGEIERLGNSVPKWLRPVDRGALIRHVIQSAPCENGRDNRDRSRVLAALDADAAATIILKEVLTLPDRSGNCRYRVLQELVAELPRRALLAAVTNDAFSRSSKAQNEHLVGILSPHSAGGGASASTLDGNVRALYRQRLLEWLAHNPEMDSHSAKTLALLATLIGEIQDSRDADTLYALLQAEDQRLKAQQRMRLEARNKRQPQPYDSLISWTHWHEAALGRIPGERSIAIHLELLSVPKHVGYAAIRLSDLADAPVIDTSGGTGRRARYDLIHARRSGSELPSAPHIEYCQRIRTAVEKHAALRGDDTWPAVADSVFRALYAVARLGGDDDINWILLRLEKDFPESTAEDLIELIVLRGYPLQGSRILTILRRTIAVVTAPYQDRHQHAWRITKVLSALFFSDSPEEAVLLLDDELSWFRTTFEFSVLCGHLAHCLAPQVVGWVRGLLANTEVRQELSDSWWNAALHQARQLQDFDFLLAIPIMLAAGGRPARSEAQATVGNALYEYATENPAFAEQILATAATTTELDTANVWAEILGRFENEQATSCIFALAQRFGSALPVLKSLYPSEQQGGSMTFTGPFYLRRQVLARSPAAMDKLRELALHADPSMRLPAQRALLWLERERLTEGPFSSGSRQGLPVEAIDLR